MTRELSSLISTIQPNNLTALVLVGGLGSRLRPVIGDLPKPLVPVAGRPFLDHVLAYLCSSGVRDVVLCTGYGASQIQEHYGTGTRVGLEVRYSQEPEALGTGGAVKHAEPLIRSDPFLVLNGDSLVQADLVELCRFHQERQAKVSLALVTVPERSRFGSVVIRTDGTVGQFAEKGQVGPGYINGGIYLVSRSVLASLSECRQISLEREVFPPHIGMGLYGLVAEGNFLDIGTPDAYASANAALAVGRGALAGGSSYEKGIAQ